MFNIDKNYYDLKPSGIGALSILWNNYKDIVKNEAIDVNQWLDEFFFCLLGGYGITYELNESAFLILKNKGLFEKQIFAKSEDSIFQLFQNELNRRQFSPRGKNGNFRAYRFPNSKGLILTKAGKWLKDVCDFKLENVFSMENSSQENRNFLLSCPGFGYKSSSWFLRNIGLGSDLAILDIHIYRTLLDFGIIPENLQVQTNYLEIEDYFCKACDLINAKPELMDLIIWMWARKGNEKNARL